VLPARVVFLCGPVHEGSVAEVQAACCAIDCSSAARATPPAGATVL
jgi:hypothetical protein